MMWVLRLKPMLVLSLLMATLGCQECEGRNVQEQRETDFETASSPPGSENFIDVMHPGYKPQPGALHECLGRMVFDVPSQIEWATAYVGSGELFNGAFSKKIFDRGDELTVDNTRIAVLGPLSQKQIDAIFEMTPRSVLRMQKSLLQEEQKFLASLAYEKTAPDALARKKYQSERRIYHLGNAIKNSENGYEEFDAKVEDSEGSWRSESGAGTATTVSTYAVYLRHSDFVYVFESTATLTDVLTKQAHANQVRALLAKFKTRRPYEVPIERGVCIPHGFIPDDGTTRTEMKQSLRFPDAPGVLYTIHTGNVHARGIKFTPLDAAARARMGKNGTFEDKQVKPYITERIGPRLYKIGGLTGEQGGVALKITEPGTAQYETYSIFTGYSGWLGSAVLPFITVDMTTRTTLQAPELKSNPPPFKSSMSRLEFILKNMRLRPTTPLMPELATVRK
jgi:hypothetical protein